MARVKYRGFRESNNVVWRTDRAEYDVLAALASILQAVKFFNCLENRAVKLK